MSATLIEVKNLIPLEFCRFFTHVLLRASDITSDRIDPQVPTAKAMMSHDVMFETLLEYLWPTVEAITQQELLPTYAFARLYSNDDELKKHIDRHQCEVSVTIQLSKSHDYSWPIYMGDKEFILNEGDGVIYPGNGIEHWRNPCKGPENYYSGHVFLHYVKKNGLYADHFADEEMRLAGGYPSVTFKKHRV